MKTSFTLLALTVVSLSFVGCKEEYTCRCQHDSEPPDHYYTTVKARNKEEAAQMCYELEPNYATINCVLEE